MRKVKQKTFFLQLIFLLILVGCNSGGNSDTILGVNSGPNVNINLLAVNPSKKFLLVGGSHTFAATGGTPPYNFTLDSGVGNTLANGDYTAPGVPGNAVIRVTDSEGKSAFGVITVAYAISISPTSSTINSGDTLSFTGSGGSPPYSYQITSGSGSINSTTGLYDSTGVASGSAVIRVKDSEDNTAYGVAIINPTLNINSTTSTIGVNETLNFSTTGGSLPYTYSVIAGDGTITTTGFLTAGSTTGSILVRVTDGASNTQDAVITVVNKPQISPDNKLLAIDKSFTFTASGGTTPYTFSIASGAGSINATTGAFTAGPTSGTTVVRVTDNAGFSDDTSVTIYYPKQIAVGAFYSCAIDFTSTSSVTKCWGNTALDNYSTAFLGAPYKFIRKGDEAGEMGDNLETINLGTGFVPRAVAQGFYTVCAISTSDELKCWGYNNSGNLGRGDRTHAGAFPDQMGDNLLKVNLGTGRTINNAININDVMDMDQSTVCVILDNQQLRCWGYNNRGQLGLGNNQNRGDNPSEVGDGIPNVNLGGDSAAKVSVGYESVCVLTTTGKVKCWGRNTDGQLGIENTTRKGHTGATTPNNLNYTDLGTTYVATDIASGYYHYCALLNTGAVKCWGDNSYGQLGQGNTTQLGDNPGEMGNNLLPIDLGTGRTATQVCADVNYSCALLDNNQVKCWGDNRYGQLGLGHSSRIGDGAGEMGDVLPTINLGTGRSASRIYCGHENVCAKLDNGTTKCWGRNNAAQLGAGHTFNVGRSGISMGDNLQTLNLGTGRSATQIAGGASSVCALLDNNTIKCWGQDYYGSRGHEDQSVGDESGEMGSNLLSVNPGSGLHFTQVKSTIYNTCGLTNTNKLKCWGRNTNAALGRGHSNVTGLSNDTLGDNHPFMDFGTGRTVKDFSVSHLGGCAILDNNTTKCWGYNNRGQLGQGNTHNRGDNSGEMGDNLAVTDFGAGLYATKISAYYEHACVVLNNGKIKCWGEGQYGKLGQGNTANRGDGAGEMGASLAYAELGTGLTATNVCVGEHHSCALLNNKKVKCWGYRNRLAKGSGTQDIGDNAGEMGDNLAYANLGTNYQVDELACGRNHTCAIMTNGRIKCWGDGAYGKLGLGNTSFMGDAPTEVGDALSYVNLGFGRTAVHIQLGDNHSCAVLDNNEIKCWGYNGYGQLGLGHRFNVGTTPLSLGDNLPNVDFD